MEIFEGILASRVVKVRAVFPVQNGACSKSKDL